MSTLPFKLNQDHRHRIPRQRHRVTNWPAYDASLRQRGSLTVWFTDEAIESWAAEPPTTPGGQPWYSALAILTVLTLRAVFRLAAYRQAEGLLGSIVDLLGLSLRVPDHTTLSRRAATLEVPRPQPDDSDRPDAGPVHLLVDSTGLRLCGAGEWLTEKHGTKRRRSWKKLHLGVDAATQAGPLLDQVARPVASFTGDGGYDQEGVYAEVAAHERRRSQRRSGYGRRSRDEVAIRRWKRVIGDGLRSRMDKRRATEVKVAVYTLNRMLGLGRPEYVRVV